MNLSKDSNSILEKVMLTNSYFQNKYYSEEFLKFKTNFLIKNNDLELIKIILLSIKI